MHERIKILLLDCNGSAKKISLTDARNQAGLIWVRLKPSNLKGFFKKMLLDHSPLISSFLSAEETRPRMICLEDSLLATYRGINCSDGEEPEDMVSIRVWINNNLIVTVQHRQLQPVDAIEDSLSNGAGAKSSAEFIVTLLESLTAESATTVSLLSDQLDQIEEFDVSQQQQEQNDVLLSKLRRRIIYMHRHIQPQHEAINSFATCKLSWLSNDNINHLKEVANANRIILENLHAERERTKVIKEEFSAYNQEQLNKKMYLIAIVTAIFMPLTFITGLFGVNLGGIPGAASSHSFLLLIVVLAFIGVIQIILLKKWGWFK